MSGTVCRFFTNGYCRFGTGCKFLHPGEVTRAGGGVPTATIDYNPPTPESIRADINEKPTWTLSSYGPGKNPPAQLIDGKDVSFEEMRLLAYESQAQGNFGAYEQEWNRLNTEAETQMRNIVNDIGGALNFLAQAHNNRDSVYRYKQPNGDIAAPDTPFSTQNANPFGSSTSSATSNPFGQPSQPAQPAFGQPTFGQSSQPTSAFGAPSPFATATASTPAFGQPAFGQTSTPTSAFGQPSALGSSTSAFGKPAQPAFGQSTFGQPSTLGGASTSAFGQPSALGTTTSAFGQTSALGSTAPSAFGKPTGSAFGQPAFGQNTFGQPQQPTNSTFGAPAPAAANPFGSSASAQPAFGQPAFGQPAFGQTSLGASGPSPFASAASQAAAPTNANPFGAPASTSNAFGQPSQPAAANPFGQPSQPAATNAFGQSQQQQNTASPFTQANLFQQAQQTATPAAANPFNQTSSSLPAVASPFGQPAVSTAANPFGSTQPQASNFSKQNLFQSGQQQPPATPGRAIPAGLPATPGGSKWMDPVPDYTDWEKQQFAAPRFEFGAIPLVAPPQAMC